MRTVLFSLLLLATGKSADGPPVHGQLKLIGHDAAGRTKTATATYNTFSADGATLVVDYTSDQFLCSGFQ